MRREEPAHRFTVQISPSAWKQIASLPADTYRRVREELEAVATRLVVVPAPTPPSTKEAATALALLVKEYVVLYDVDMERRSVMLLEVALRQPARE